MLTHAKNIYLIAKRMILPNSTIPTLAFELPTQVSANAREINLRNAHRADSRH